MSYEPRTDPRVRRTRQALHDALLTLLEERDLAAIGVQDIVRTASVNRATFYLHYRDKDEFAQATLDGEFERLVSNVRGFVAARRPITAEQPPAVLQEMFRTVGARPGLYTRLLSTFGPGTFASRLREVIEAETLRQWPDLHVPIGEGDAPPEFRARFAASATLGTMTWWLRMGATEPVETVTGWLWALLQPIWFGHESDTGEPPVSDHNPLGHNATKEPPTDGSLPD
jgi:AcrR family transcriptional regulator